MAKRGSPRSSPPPAPRLPGFARVVRALPSGMHAYLTLLPRLRESPALPRIAPDPARREPLIQGAQVRIEERRGYCMVDITVPCIVLAAQYYRDGSDLDLYLDLLHELTHLRQHHEGHDVWDEAHAYVDRPTEIEAYAVAVDEGRRLGMTDHEIMAHLSNPWMSAPEVERLLGHVEDFLARAR